MNKLPYDESRLTVRAEEFELCLIKLYGVIVGGKDLRHLLGYKTGSAFRLAVMRNQIPFPTFIMEGRRMRMARTHDIAKWLASIEADLDSIKRNNKTED